MAQKAGRPRCEETKNTILLTAYRLFMENGFKAVTVDGIAEKAGVSKATIYKWWPNKAAVVLDAFLEATEALLPVPDTGYVREDLFQHIHNLATFFLSREGKGITELIAEGQFDPYIAEEYKKRYFIPRRLITKSILERGIERNQIHPNTDLALLTDLLFAPIFYRLMITRDTIDRAYINAILEQSLKGILL